jgi:5-methylcytosine-specific restriction endonuclease McrA
MKKYQLEIIGASFLCLLLACFAVMLRTRVPEPIPPDQQAESIDTPEPPDGKLTAPRSSKWKAVRDAFVEKHPECEACGSRQKLAVHHILPFHERPELELEESNLVTLCQEHHFRIGHDPDGPEGPEKPNWSKSNPNVKQDAERHRVNHE